MKRALITGITGQDGFYLAEFLLEQGYRVYGVDRTVEGLSHDLKSSLHGIEVMDVRDPRPLGDLVQRLRPHETYHLAAHHFSSQTDLNRVGQVAPFIAVNLLAADAILDSLRRVFPEGRFFYPASAQIFGRPDAYPQSEATPPRPDTPYAISKAAGLYLCRYYRSAHHVFAAAGILYNHESPRRPAGFVTTEIARAAARAALGNPSRLVLRDLDAVVDWGAAQDYVRAMWLVLQQGRADEFVIASGIARTVREFAEEAFAVVGLSAADYVTQESPVVGRDRVPYVGDSTKIRMQSGWEPAVSFTELVRSLVGAQLERLKEAAAE